MDTSHRLPKPVKDNILRIRYDEETARKLEYIQKTQKKSLSQIIRDQIDRLYEELCSDQET